MSCNRIGSQEAGDEEDERVISTRVQQARDEILPGFRIFYCHGEMQWCGLIEFVDWVYVAVFVGENVFKHVCGGIFDSSTSLSRALSVGYRARESHARCKASPKQRRRFCIQLRQLELGDLI